MSKVDVTSGHIAVLDADRVLLDDGRTFRLEFPVEFHDLVRKARNRNITQIWLGPGNDWQISSILSNLRHNGWTVQPDGEAPWMLAYERGMYGAVALAFPAKETRAPWRDAETPEALLAALCAYRDALGTAYAYSPGATGTHLLRELHTGRGTLDLSASIAPADMPPPAREATETDLFWIRPLTQEERGHTYLHSFDKNAMYLAACSSLPVGFGAPQHFVGAEASNMAAYDPEPGYWLAEIAWERPEALPDPFARARRSPGPRWITTPTLKLAIEQYAVSGIHEAYVWPEAHYPFTSWQRRMKGAREQLRGGEQRNRLAYAALKATYTQAIGWLDGSWLRRQEEPADLYRPDWRHALIATARANLYRNIAKAYTASRRAPFAVGTDALYYTSDDAWADTLHNELGLRMGSAPGEYKVKDEGVPLSHLPPIFDTLDAGGNPSRLLHELQEALNERRGVKGEEE